MITGSNVAQQKAMIYRTLGVQLQPADCGICAGRCQRRTATEPVPINRPIPRRLGIGAAQSVEGRVEKRKRSAAAGPVVSVGKPERSGAHWFQIREIRRSVKGSGAAG